MNNTMASAFRLKKISLYSWIYKLIPIPVGILTASLMSRIVSFAVAGQTVAVLKTGGVLAFMILGVKSLQVILDIYYERLKENGLHACKIELYKSFLGNPLSVLYASDRGRSLEKLNDDFKTWTARSITLLPGFGVGILTGVTYLAILAVRSRIVAVILLGISLMQILPPIIVKKYMQVNYDNCREIEGKLADFQMGAYGGFATIKLYELKTWWLDKLMAYHKEYTRIGNVSIYTGTAENAMDELIAVVLKYGTYACLGLLILAEQITLETGVWAIALSGSLYGSVKTIFSSIPGFAVADTAKKRLEEWFPEAGEDTTEMGPEEEVKAKKIGKKANLVDNRIVLDQVSCVIDGKEILGRASAEFAADKVTVIKGVNGAGKSTLFRLITGLIIRNEGTVTVGGIKPEQIGEKAFPGDIFYLPQEDAIFEISPKMLMEMIDSEKTPEFLKMTERFKLSEEEVGSAKISELSGGERKKVYLSLAFAVDPLFLLLDEPANHLDQEGIAVLMQLLKERKGGALIISHDPALDEVADCFCTVEKGGILYADEKH